MTDDQTRPIETTPPTAAAPAPAPEAAAGEAAPAAAPVAPTPASDAVPLASAPTSTPTSAPPATGPSRVRWAVGLGVAGLAIVGAIAVFLLLGAQSSPEALRYVPGNAALVAELRLDLPGDQMQRLGTFLAHFPGFADQATLGAKLDEALGKFVTSASDGKATYLADVKPWVNGPLFLGVMAPADGSSADATGPRDVVISATTNGAASCTAAFKDQQVTHEAYRAFDLVLGPGATLACVLDGRQALIGDPTTLKAAIDAKAAGTGMDRSATYQKARSALGGDRLATMFMSTASFKSLMPTPSAMPIPGLGALSGELPEWIMAGVRAEDDALVFDTVVAPTPASSALPSLLPLPAAHGSLITGALPATTLGYVEVQGAGVGLQNLLTLLRTVPDLQQPLQMLDGAGGAGELVGWIDDIGLAVLSHDPTPDVAVVLVGKDESAVTTRVASLKALLGLAGLGNGMTQTETTINGTAVTNITINDLGSLLPPGAIPGGGLPSATGPITFSLAAHGRTLILTTGEAAMTTVLGTAAGSSLADQAAFKQAAARGLTNSQTTLYLGLGATIDLVKGFMSADELAKFQADVAPYLDPLEAVLISATTDASGSRSRIVITVSKP
jgi:Protein of unknown function (DUF3352)